MSNSDGQTISKPVEMICTDMIGSMKTLSLGVSRNIVKTLMGAVDLLWGGSLVKDIKLIML